jgi:hypothetical protein
MKLDLPGGLDRDELAAIKRLSRELSADGYRVGKVGLGAGDLPCALVYAARPTDPIRRIVVAARSILRAVEAIEELAPEVTAEEFETLQALRTTSTLLARSAVVGGEQTLGDVAHEVFGLQARRGADLIEEE